jgi:hypothetical protein
MFVVAQVSSGKISREASSFDGKLLQAGTCFASIRPILLRRTEPLFSTPSSAAVASPTSPDGSPQTPCCRDIQAPNSAIVAPVCSATGARRTAGHD